MTTPFTDRVLLAMISDELVNHCDDNPLLENFWLDMIENIHDLQEGDADDEDCDGIEEDWSDDLF